tara:strand:- start:263 stop:628 length:366 start_codon:yes stop_codon:yes gene_type:complete
MANPSTTGGSGAGTEVLRRAYKDSLTSSGVKIIDGVIDHIYTVLSVIFTEQAGNTDELINMVVDIEASGTEIILLAAHPITAKGTFVWNDKIVLTGTDELVVSSDASATIDCYVTFIDQEF